MQCCVKYGKSALRNAVLGSSLILMAGTLHADDTAFWATQSFSIERGADLATEDDPAFAATSLENRLNATTELYWRNRLNNGSVLSFRQTIEALAYPEHDTLNRLTSHSEAAFRFWLDDTKTWSLQLKSRLSFSQAPEQSVYKRIRVGATLRYHLNKQHTFRFRARLGYRDQNDLRFSGFDQRETLIELGHDWRHSKNGARLSTTLYFENRSADAIKYIYDEYGLRFRVKHALSKDLSINGGFSVYQRIYKGPFSASLPINRDEVRFKAGVEVTKRFSDRITGFARIGWDENQSSIYLRDYAGATFGLGVTINLN